MIISGKKLGKMLIERLENEDRSKPNKAEEMVKFEKT
jgi:hypothetical protein